MRILLTGKDGQIGGELLGVLPPLGELIALGRWEMDVSRPQEIRRAIRALRPELIVNAAAYTRVDDAESDESTARGVNAEAPALMAREAAKIGATLVHYSTDYIFSGAKTTP